jgi:predicted glycogen debranching enzyme
LLEREWLTANGIGGYACSTLPGLNTRKYHGLLVAAMAPPVRRMVLLSRVEETLWHNGRRFALDCNEYPGVIYPQGQRHLREFFPGRSPRWTYEGEGWRIEKQLTVVAGSNTVLLTYKLISGDAIDLQLRPLMALRPIHNLRYQFIGRLATDDRGPGHHRVAATSGTPEVFFAHDGNFTPGPNWYLNQIYRREQQRGYAGLEDLWTPGAVRFHLTYDVQARFACSTDPIDLKRLKPASTRPRRTLSGDPTLRLLHNAAEQFLVSNTTEEGTACVAGYPWLGVRTRDALIGFTGLLLIPGRLAEAREMLLSLASRMKKGLVPSEFPEDGGEPVYRAADISLWFANSVWNYLRYAPDADDTTVGQLLDAILATIAHYRVGTDLGIGVDTDGLLKINPDKEAATWMDAKVGDWVVTPRTGKPIELNALWYNATRIAAVLSRRLGRHDRAELLSELANSVFEAFNRQFWNIAQACCFDVVGDDRIDAGVRPNQILAASLPFPVLSADRHEAVLQKVENSLLVPTGIRTLSPDDPNYHGRYHGNVSARDAAHHNGSAFPWLLGPYAQLLRRVRGHNDSTRAAIRALLGPCITYAADAGMGQIPELFDGDAPHRPGGTIASAASVGQILRCYAEDVLDTLPAQTLTPPAKPARKPRALAPRQPSRADRNASLRSGHDR